MNESNIRYRREAVPVSVAQLSASQKDARKFIVEQIYAASELLKKTEKIQPETIHIDRNRRNQVVFVSGSRGSGKTSVVLSIIDEFINKNELSSSKEGDSSTKTIRELEGKVEWLELLDMDPMPENTNLLLALLARIQKTLERSTASTNPNRDYNEASQALRKMQSDLALAWDGNLETRKGNIDIDQYATELKRVEAARISLNPQLRQTLQAVAKAIGKEGCLFVLVVDDFDLNPLKAIELIQFLRIFSVPELCTIMLGDLDIAEEMFSLVLAGKIDTLAPDNRSLLFTSPTEISANALRKLLPLTQRITIENFKIEEALKFDPDGNIENKCLTLEDISNVLENRKSGQSVETASLAELTGELLNRLHDCEPNRDQIIKTLPEEISERPSKNSLDNLLANINFQIIHWPMLLEGKSSSHGNNSETNEVQTSQANSNSVSLNNGNKPAEGQDKPEKNNQTISLREFLLVKSKLPQKDKNPNYIYHAVQMLAAPPRHIADLWLKLMQLGQQTASSEENGNRSDNQDELDADYLLNLSANLLIQALNEDSELTSQGRYVLRKSFYKDPLQNEWELDVNNIHLHGRTGSDFTLTNVRPKLYDGETVHCRVIVRRFFRWMIQPIIPLEHDYQTHRMAQPRTPLVHGYQLPSENTWQDVTLLQKTRRGRAVSTYSTSAYMLFHDLLLLTNKGSVIGRVEDDNMEQRAYTEWQVGMQRSFTVPWFTSAWETFRDFSQFTDIWNTGKVVARETRYSGSQVNDTDITRFMAYVWIVGGLATLSEAEESDSDDESDSEPSVDILHYLNRAKESINQKDSEHHEGPKPHEIVESLLHALDVNEESNRKHREILSRRINEMAQTLMKRRKQHADDFSTILLLKWFVNLAYLLSPETGVDIKIFQDLELIEAKGKDPDDRSQWKLQEHSVWELWLQPFVAREIRRHRAERLGKFAYSERGLKLVAPHLYQEARENQSKLKENQLVLAKTRPEPAKTRSEPGKTLPRQKIIDLLRTSHPFNQLKHEDYFSSDMGSDEKYHIERELRGQPIFAPSKTEVTSMLMNQPEREYSKNPGTDPDIYQYFFPHENIQTSGSNNP